MFKLTFDTPFDQYARLHGKPFVPVTGPLSGTTNRPITFKGMRRLLAACGDQPYFKIKFENGEVISAHPEEVLAEYTWEYGEGGVNPNDVRTEAERLAVSTS